jgi:cellulose biosynthesis protein BcsQ
MDTYVFANQKRGVGKTTVTLGVGAGPGARRTRVLLVDLDGGRARTGSLRAA